MNGNKIEQAATRVFYVIKRSRDYNGKAYVTGPAIVYSGVFQPPVSCGGNAFGHFQDAIRFTSVAAALEHLKMQGVSDANTLVRVEETTVPSTPSIEEVHEGEVLPVNCQWAVKWHERFLTLPPKAVSNFMAENISDGAALFPSQQAALDALVKAQAVNGQGLTYTGAQLVRVRVTNSEAKITRTETVLA